MVKLSNLLEFGEPGTYWEGDTKVVVHNTIISKNFQQHWVDVSELDDEFFPVFVQESKLEVYGTKKKRFTKKQVRYYELDSDGIIQQYKTVTKFVNDIKYLLEKGKKHNVGVKVTIYGSRDYYNVVTYPVFRNRKELENAIISGKINRSNLDLSSDVRIVRAILEAISKFEELSRCKSIVNNLEPLLKGSEKHMSELDPSEEVKNLLSTYFSRRRTNLMKFIKDFKYYLDGLDKDIRAIGENALSYVREDLDKLDSIIDVLGTKIHIPFKYGGDVYEVSVLKIDDFNVNEIREAYGTLAKGKTKIDLVHNLFWQLSEEYREMYGLAEKGVFALAKKFEEFVLPAMRALVNHYKSKAEKAEKEFNSLIDEITKVMVAPWLVV